MERGEKRGKRCKRADKEMGSGTRGRMKGPMVVVVVLGVGGFEGEKLRGCVRV